MRTFSALLVLTVLSIPNCLSQTSGSLLISFDTWNLDFIVTDLGYRHSGVDPRSGRQFDEIPNTGYGYEGISSLDENDTNDMNAVQFETTEPITDPTFAELYTLELIGKTQFLYRGYIQMRQTESHNIPVVEVSGIIDTFQSVSYRIYYATDSTISPRVVKLIDGLLMDQDLKSCHDLGFVKVRSLYLDLGKIARQAHSLFHAKDNTSARSKLQQFKNLIDQSSLDTMRLNANGYKILRADIDAWIDQTK